jgi:hypothetical protein
MPAITNNVPNLDCIDRDELLLFWVKHRKGKNVTALFPDSEGDERLQAVLALVAHVLSEYALTKAAAIGARMRGAIADAQGWERECESIYRGLPSEVRW